MRTSRLVGALATVRVLWAVPAAAQRPAAKSPPLRPRTTAVIPALDGALVTTLVLRDSAADVQPFVDSARAAVYRLDSLVVSTDSAADVTRVNRAAGRAAVKVSPQILQLLRTARYAWQLSGHLLDPTDAPLLGAIEERERTGLVPPAAELDSLRSLMNLAEVRTDSATSTVELPRAGMRLDLALFARGRGLDLAREAFPDSVVAGGVIQVGTTSRVWGRPPYRGPWRLVLVPPGTGRRAIGEAVLDSGAVVVAADSEQSPYDRRHYVHLVNPQTGYIPMATASVIAIAPTAARANAEAAALYMLPPERALAVADSLGLAAVIIRRPASGKPAGAGDVLVSGAADPLLDLAAPYRRSRGDP